MIAASLTTEDLQHFQDLVPWYVNDTLGSRDRHRMVRVLSASAECRAELYEVIALAETIRNETVSWEKGAGLGRLMAMVRTQGAAIQTPMV